MKGIVALFGRRLLQNPVRSLLTLSGVAGASALLVAVLGLSASLTGSIAKTSALAGRTDVLVAAIGDTGFDQRAFFTVTSTPGVRTAVPFIQGRVRANGVQTFLLGFDERIRALGVASESDLGRRALGPRSNFDGVFLGSALATRLHARVGETISVRSGVSSVHQAKVLGIFGGHLVSSFNQGNVAFAALPVAQSLANKPAGLDGIYVLRNAGTSTAVLEDRLTHELKNVASVSSPKLLASQAGSFTAPLRFGLLTVTFMSLFVAGFVVFNTMNVAALERRRELATLRALGGRRRMLFRGFLAEACALGFIGSLVGAAIGAGAARLLVDRIPQSLIGVFGIRPGFSLPTYAIPAALLLGVGLAMVGALAPARRAVGVPPVEAMREEGTSESTDGPRTKPRALALGAAAFIAGVVLALFGGTWALFPADNLIWIGAFLATWAGAVLLTSLAGRLLALAGTAGHIAAASLSRAPRRVWGTTMAVLVAVAIAVAMAGTEANTSSGLRASFTALRSTDAVVTTRSPDDPAADLLLPDVLGARLSDLAGIARTVRGQDAYATVATLRVMLRGIDGPTGLTEFRSAKAPARSAVLRETGVIVTKTLAHSLHLQAGQTLTLPTPTGAKSLRVAQVVETFGNNTAVVISLHQLQTWFHRPGLSRIELTYGPGVDRPKLDATVRNVVRASSAPAVVQSGAQAAAAAVAVANQIASAFNAMQIVVLIGAALAILNTLLIAVVERKRELGILRAIGTSRRLIFRSVLAEAGVIATLGGAAGLVLGSAQHYLSVIGTRTVGAIPVTYHFLVWPLVRALIAAVIVSALGALLPAWRASRLNVLEAIGYE